VKCINGLTVSMVSEKKKKGLQHTPE